MRPTRTVEEQVAAMDVAHNKHLWCDAHCERRVGEDWRTYVVHVRECPWAGGNPFRTSAQVKDAD